MERYFEKHPTFSIEAPKLGDEILLAPMHIQSWKETYVSPQSGLTEEMVDELLGHMLTDTEFRKNTILESIQNPDKVLYRVVKNKAGDIVGFMHGSKDETGNKLEGLYLLDEVKGSGIGGLLMDEFLQWIDPNKITQLEVFDFNDRAISFYTKYGFVKTDEPIQFWKDRLPFFKMERSSDALS